MKVSVVKCNDYEQKNVDDSIKEALNLINFKFKEGIKVLLKPNLIGAFKAEYAVTTHPSIIIALCKILKEKNTEIYLGDSPGIPNIKKVFEITGMEEVAKKYNIKLVNFNSSKTIKLKREQNKILKESSFPDIIEKVDLIINLPKLKTHVFTQYTGAIKNLYGFIIGGKKSHYHLVNKTEKKFSEMLIDIHDLIKPQLIIMDAVIGMEGNGPTYGIPKQTDLILASKNCIALDIVASEIIGYKTKDIPMIIEAKKRGFNHKIERLGVPNIRVEYKKPFTLHQKLLPPIIRNLEFNIQISIDNDKCTKCLICYKQCPSKAIKIKNGNLFISKKECIKCYCCHELCPAHAIEIKNPLFAKYGKKLIKLLISFKGKVFGQNL